MCDKLHYDKPDERVTDLEKTVAEMRSECREGFSAARQRRYIEQTTTSNVAVNVEANIQ